MQKGREEGARGEREELEGEEVGFRGSARRERKVGGVKGEGRM